MPLHQQLLTAAKGNRLWLAAYAALLVIPWALIYSRSLADGCLVLICLLWLSQSAAKKQWGWLKDPLVATGLCAWLWLLAVVSPLAADRMDSFSIALPWIRYIIFYAALRYWVLTSKESLFFLGQMLAAMLAFIAADTLWQYVHDVSLTGKLRAENGRLTGPFDNVKVGIFAAKMLIPAMGLCFFIALMKRSRPWIAGGFGLLVIVMTTIMLSGERTAFCSAFLSLLAAALCLAYFEPAFRKFCSITSLLLVVVVGYLLLTQPWVQVRAGEFYLTLQNFGASDYGQLYKAGYLLGMENPLTGTGLKGFRALCPELIAQGKIISCNLHPHNAYLEWFSEAGIVGLLLFLAMLYTMARLCVQTFKEQHGMYRLLPAFALACLISNFFPFMPTQSFFSNWPAILLWFCVSVSLASLNMLERSAK
jgi:O-antigen ligase